MQQSPAPQESVAFILADSPATRQTARGLIAEYLQWIAASAAQHYGLAFDVDAMLDADIASPGVPASPGDRLYLVRRGENDVGVGCLRRLDNATAEIQRMYLQPAVRGQGTGRLLLDRLLADARAIGYRTVRLESLKFLSSAHALYRSAGFIETPPYTGNAMRKYHDEASLPAYQASAVFMALQLDGPGLQAIDLQAKLSTFEGHWQPRTVAEYNGHDVMVVKVQGEYHWHSHPDTDDFFYVLAGALEIDLPDRTVQLGPGQLFVVPRGVRHRPRAVQETQLLLIEPTGTPNSGDTATAAPRRVI